MSVERVFVWQCTLCGTSVKKPDYGLPAGWAWYAQGVMGVAHACVWCQVQEGNDRKYKFRY
jgi:hypothetical protein